jgi:hypothetical protein
MSTPGYFRQLLPVADMCQRRAETFIIYNRALRYLTDRVETPIGEFDAIVQNFELAVRIVGDGDPLAPQAACYWRRLQNKNHLVVLQGQALGDCPFLAPGEHIIELVLR